MLINYSMKNISQMPLHLSRYLDYLKFSAFFIIIMFPYNPQLRIEP